MAAAAAVGLALLPFSACGSDTSFDVRYAPTYAPPRTVSVFGVFRDGRMSTESWDVMGARLSRPLGGAPCEVAVGARLQETAPSLVAALDDVTRAGGVTDEVLAELAPMAKSDVIVLFTVAGRPPQVLSDAGPVARAPPSTSRFNTGGRGGRAMTGPSSTTRRTDRNAFEVSASFYSVSAKASVGLIAMAYEGSTVEDALEKFAAKLALELPGARCDGWNYGVSVDEARLRALRR